MEFKCKEFSLNHTLSSMKVGTDAILLSSLAERNHKKHILEIGTGCGIISLAMAQLNKTAKITSIDIDEESIKQAKDNFQKSKWADRLFAKQISLQDFAEIKEEQTKLAQEINIHKIEIENLKNIIFMLKDINENKKDDNDEKEANKNPEFIVTKRKTDLLVEEKEEDKENTKEKSNRANRT